MIFSGLASHSAWIQLGLSLAHFLWQGAAIAMLLAVVLFVMRRRAPEVRHGLCLGAMIAMGLCPLATLWYFQVNPPTGIFADVSSSSASTRVAVREPDAARIVNPPLEAVGQPGKQPAESSPLAALTEVEMPADDAPMGAPASVTPATVTPSVVARPHVPALAWGLTIAALVWAIGVAVLGVRFVFAWLGLRKLRGETEALPEAIERLAVRLRGVLGMRGDVPIRASQSVAEPLAFGLLRPIVLVPAALLTQCPVEMLEAIIAHELAHIRRHDLWINLLQRAIETLLFYHPAVWWVSGRMRLERELCCDDAAILATGKRADYANALVELSRSLHGWTAPALSAGMFTSRLSLPDRVRRVLQVPSAQHDPNRGRYWMTGPATLLLAGSLVLVSSLRPGVAQNAGPASDAAATQPSVSTPGQGAFNPKWQQLTDAAPQRRWSNVKIADALTDFSNLSGLNIVATQVIPSDLQKAINVDVSKARNFDEALTTLNTALFDANYWGVVNNGNLILRPLSEWYRNVPAEHMFMSENEYREAKLPEWDVAGVVFEPRSWPADVLANEATDLTPLNGARAMITPDGRRVRLIGFVRFINTQLAIMKKWDVPPAPSSDALARSRNLPAAGPRPTVAPATRPAGDPRLPVTTSDVFSPYTSRREELPASAVPVRPLADGVVTEVPVKLGQTVKKGDLLVRLDDAEPRLELEAAKARLQQVHGLYSRYKELVSQGAVTTEEEQKAETDVKLAELDLQKWELRIDRAQVRSPADGVVQVAQASGESDARPAEAWIGKRVTAGETILYVDRGGSAPSSVTTRPAGQARPSAGVPSDFIPVSAFIPVRAPVAGVIQEVVAKPGQRVKKGDALAKLDARDAELELQAAKIRLDSTREIYDRATQLRKAGTVAEDEFLKAQTAAALAEVDLQRAQLQLERATIRSPIDGVFTDFDKSLLGQAVEVGRTLFSIAPMPEKQPANAGDTPVVPGLSPAR